LPPSGGGREWLELDAVAEALEALLESTRDVLALALIEVQLAEILEGIEAAWPTSALGPHRGIRTS
jgi:hypothetical protein